MFIRICFYWRSCPVQWWSLPCLLRLTSRTSDPLSQTRNVTSIVILPFLQGGVLLLKSNKQYKWAKCNALRLVFRVLGEISQLNNPLLFQLKQMKFSRCCRAKLRCSKQALLKDFRGEAVWIYWRMCLQQGASITCSPHRTLVRKWGATHCLLKQIPPTHRL